MVKTVCVLEVLDAVLYTYDGATAIMAEDATSVLKTISKKNATGICIFRRLALPGTPTAALSIPKTISNLLPLYLVCMLQVFGAVCDTYNGATAMAGDAVNNVTSTTGSAVIHVTSTTGNVVHSAKCTAGDVVDGVKVQPFCMCFPPHLMSSHSSPASSLFVTQIRGRIFDSPSPPPPVTVIAVISFGSLCLPHMN